MGDSYDAWLDAALQYVQTLKEQGERWITLRPETQDWLATARRPAPAAAHPTTVASVAPPPRPAPAPARSAPRPTEPKIDIASAVSAPGSAAAPAGGAAPDLASASKLEALTELRNRVMACQQCPNLAASRTSTVFGVGDPTSPLMFVGEAPGADEDRQGEPFVGAAGQLLTRIIKAMGFARETVYIANILKCRPDTPGQAYGNRKPTPDEMQRCLPYLLEQIKIIQPKVIVALGATAMEGLFGRVLPISKARGHWHDFGGTPVMPTYHPSYLLRNQAATVKREVWEDMLQVMERLAVPISEKQRNYFK